MKRATIGTVPLSIHEVLDIADGKAEVTLSEDEDWRERMQKGPQFLDDEWRSGNPVYGVTTGYGHSCTVGIPDTLVEELPHKLVQFHGCGLGKTLDKTSARAVLAVRLCSFSRGRSGVRLELMKRLCELLNHDIVPLIPEEGSVGASGDLTPLSYVAATLIGEREVVFKGRQMSAADALKECDLEPLQLRPKEGLALMNGTSVMTALGCVGFRKAEYLAKLASLVTAGAVEALGGNRGHFGEELHLAKPHPGQIEVAKLIRSSLAPNPLFQVANGQLQDRYSLRCAPHVIGVLADALQWSKQVIEIELNSANDNPLIDADKRKVYHGGHFYGGHLSFVCDMLKNAVANVADLLDRQMALLMSPVTNRGLPTNLSGATGERASINHGFKAVQIGASAWCAEALKQTMPASVFSRSTECHNQDKVSMGTISSRDLLRVLELTEQTTAAQLLAVTQAILLRIHKGDFKLASLRPQLRTFVEQTCSFFELVEEDRPLEKDLRTCLSLMRKEHWTIASSINPKRIASDL